MINKLAIDIDGCLNHLGEFLLMIVKRDYDLDISEDFGIMDSLGLKTKEDIKNFWAKYNDETLEVKPEKYSKECLDNLYKNGIELFIITARENDCGDLTQTWLSKNHYSYDHLILNSGNKIDKCKEHGIKYMIEDNPNNAMILAENGVTVLLMDRTYNKDVEHENVIRCKDWYEIESNLLKLLNLTPIILYSDSFTPTEEFEKLYKDLGYASYKLLACRLNEDMIKHVIDNSDNSYKSCKGRATNKRMVGFDGLAYVRYVDMSKEWAIRSGSSNTTGSGHYTCGYYEGIGYLKKKEIQQYNFKNYYYEFNVRR